MPKDIFNRTYKVVRKIFKTKTLLEVIAKANFQAGYLMCYRDCGKMQESDYNCLIFILQEAAQKQYNKIVHDNVKQSLNLAKGEKKK